MNREAEIRRKILCSIERREREMAKDRRWRDKKTGKFHEENEGDHVSNKVRLLPLYFTLLYSLHFRSSFYPFPFPVILLSLLFLPSFCLLPLFIPVSSPSPDLPSISTFPTPSFSLILSPTSPLFVILPSPSLLLIPLFSPPYRSVSYPLSIFPFPVSLSPISLSAFSLLLISPIRLFSLPPLSLSAFSLLSPLFPLLYPPHPGLFPCLPDYAD